MREDMFGTLYMSKNDVKEYIEKNGDVFELTVYFESMMDKWPSDMDTIIGGFELNGQDIRADFRFSCEPEKRITRLSDILD